MDCLKQKDNQILKGGSSKAPPLYKVTIYPTIMNDELTPVHPIEALHRLREAWGRRVSYEEFAFELGWSYQSICKWAGHLKRPEKYSAPSIKACRDAARLLQFHGIEA